MTSDSSAPANSPRLRAAPLRWLRLLAAVVLFGTAQPALAHLQDNFARADGAVLNNGWIEKNAAAFALAGGQVTKAAVATGYRDNLVYRPNTEDVLDVEASVELQFTNASPGYAQVAVRVQAATAATPDNFTGYLLYVNNSNTQVILGRQVGNAFVTTLSTITLGTAFNTTDRFRLRLSATGTNPVQLAGYVERLTGSIWTVIGQATFSDATATRIATAGSVGFSGYVESAYILDNFTRVDIGAVGTTNPAPATVGLSPSQVTAGETGPLVAVYGSGFTTDSVARWNGANRSTRYVSPSELELTVNTADIAVAGTAAITVSNPAPGGGVSNSQTFTFTAPAPAPPAISGLTPASATAGGAAFTLTVQGTGFDATATVRWNGAARATTYVSPTQLTASISAADISAAGTVPVTVLRGSDGALSGASSFVVSPAVAGDFFDDFNRANAADLGNGWLEKTPATFSVSGNELAKVAAGTDYRNNVVYRPASEDVLDVEASAEIRLLSTTVGYPQVLTRVLGATAAGAGQLDAYMLYLNNSTSQAVISRQRGSNYDTLLTSFTISPALNTTDRYRLRLRTTGTTTVTIAGFVERWNGSAWTIIGQGTVDDSSAQRIGIAGSVGLAGYIETAYAYDNFTRINLGSTSNPVPATTTLSPSTAVAGGGAFTLTVNGSNFVPGSVVRWNGNNRTTTYVSPTQLTAAISAADIAAAGNALVTVFNAAPGGGTSAALTFVISTPPPPNPVPAVTSLAPSSASAGSAATQITVNGSNFIAGSVVQWNGAARTTVFVSSTQLQAAITATDLATAGTAAVTVFNPAPGGGTSGSLTFTINVVNNPAPVATSLSPTSANAGTSSLTLTVNGSGFYSGSVVRWNGVARTTTFVSANQLTAAITSADLATAGTATVTVFNATPGGGTSAGLTFTINVVNNPVPAAASLVPSSASAGSPAFSLTVNGSNFVAGSVVRWNGSARTTTFVSATQLTASISGSDIAAQGSATVTVFNPTPGGGTSGNLTFTITAPVANNPQPVLTTMSPVTWPTGGAAFTLTVTGSGFNANSVVQVNGSSRATTLVSANELRASITSADVAVTVPLAVTVLNPSPGGGRSTPLTFLVQSGSTQYFIDNFNRADSTTIGNGWTEKDPTAFEIQGSELVSVDTAGGFPSNVMYRPAGEQRLDSEMSVEFRRQTSSTTVLNDANYPQIHSRIQTNTVATPGSLDSYIFFIEDVQVAGPRAMFAINRAPAPGVRYECYIAAIPLPEQLVVGDRYRLRFRTVGAAPVQLWGAVDRYVNGAWQLMATGTATHDTNTVRDTSLYCDQSTLPAPITSAGVNGIAKWVNRTDVYDNFYWKDASPLEAAPTVTSLSPASAVAGAAGFTLTVNGTGFRPDSVINWHGSLRPTTYISSTELRATISAADIAIAGTTPITVTSDLALPSGELTFSITPTTGTIGLDDTFNRANSAALGNGWVEKTASVFSIGGNRVTKSGGADYRDNIVYRPATDDRRDVEASLKFTVTASPVGYPQVMTRIQQATATTTAGFEGYLLFMDNSNTSAVLARQRLGGYETRLATFTLSQALTVGGTYRMRLRSVGDASVALTATIERLNAGQWTVVGTASATDTSASRIATGGATGFGGAYENAYTYDDFRQVNLGP